jgi:hypothetical protein
MGKMLTHNSAFEASWLQPTVYNCASSVGLVDLGKSLNV